jgi:urea transport system permease protein
MSSNPRIGTPLRRWLNAALIMALWFCFSTSPCAQNGFADAVSALNTKSFTQKIEAAIALGGISHPRTERVLRAMLDSKLYYVKKGGRVVIAEDSDGGYLIEDAATGEALGETGKRKIRKISVNNRLRSVLRDLIARIRLNNEDSDVRLRAVEEMTKDIDSEGGELLKEVLVQEADSQVKQAIDIALALLDLDNTDQTIRLAAIARLDGRVNSAVRNKLSRLSNNTSLDQETRRAANVVLLRIESKIKFYEMLETLFFGISLGSILVLAAIGLAITFGVMGVINMAHGELIMLGAYTTYVVQLAMPEHIELSLFVAIPAAFLVGATVGIAIERGIIRHLYGRPLETLLATFGVSLVLQQTVRSIFSPLNRSVLTPQWMSGSLQINDFLAITYNRLYVVIFSLLVFALLVLILKYTRLGLEVRAVTQNRTMAQAMGVRSARVDALTFGLGSGIAGIAGVALSQLTNVGPNLGQSYIVDCFMVVVFGGVGNLWGTLLGGLSLGIANKILEPSAGAVMAKILVLVFIILFIQKRPRGLFPQKGRAAEGW